MQCKPRHTHDCEKCTFLGCLDYGELQYDLYYCKQEASYQRPTVIARYSSDGPDYTSGLEFALQGISTPLVTAMRLAQERGLLPKPQQLCDVS